MRLTLTERPTDTQEPGGARTRGNGSRHALIGRSLQLDGRKELKMRRRVAKSIVTTACRLRSVARAYYSHVKDVAFSTLADLNCCVVLCEYVQVS